MTVDDLLHSCSSQELAEWEAYERALGPVGRQYDQDMLARIHEQLQMLTYVLGATNVEKAEDNPVPEPVEVVRPPDVFSQLKREEQLKEDEQQQEPGMGVEDAVAFFKDRQQ